MVKIGLGLRFGAPPVVIQAGFRGLPLLIGRGAAVITVEPIIEVPGGSSKHNDAVRRKEREYQDWLKRGRKREEKKRQRRERQKQRRIAARDENALKIKVEAEPGISQEERVNNFIAKLDGVEAGALRALHQIEGDPRETFEQFIQDWMLLQEDERLKRLRRIATAIAIAA